MVAIEDQIEHVEDFLSDHNLLFINDGSEEPDKKGKEEEAKFSDGN